MRNARFIALLMQFLDW